MAVPHLKVQYFLQSRKPLARWVRDGIFIASHEFTIHPDNELVKRPPRILVTNLHRIVSLRQNIQRTRCSTASATAAIASSVITLGESEPQPCVNIAHAMRIKMTRAILSSHNYFTIARTHNAPLHAREEKSAPNSQ